MSSSEQKYHCYQVSNHQVWINQVVESLAAYYQNLERIIQPMNDYKNVQNGAKLQIFDGESWLAEETRKITCSKNDNGYFIWIHGVSCYFVSHDGSEIIKQPSQALNVNISNLEYEQVLLGPPLLLALALKQHFSLHSSSVKTNNKAVVFVGESGFGKSTMAKQLANVEGIFRLTDDVTAISESNTNFFVHSDFPQLKLPNAHQNSFQQKTHLAAIILLNRTSIDQAKLTTLTSLDSIKALLNHGVVAQLFDKILSAVHLNFISRVAETVPIYRLDYPNGLEYIPLIAKILREEID